MKVQKIYCLCGASGTGKSTILDHVKNYYNIDVTEVSARPYLPKDGSYDETLTESSQVLITQNRLVDIISGIYNKKPTLFSRSPIDSLAYELALNKAPFIAPLLDRQVEITKPLITYIYLPIEFEMRDVNDIIRGTNEEVQVRTDYYIKEMLIAHNISHVELSGSIEERFLKLEELFKSDHIYKAK